MWDIAILGSSVAGNLTAAYLKHNQPHLKIVIIGPPETPVIVGESMIEISTYFLHQLGLSEMLEEKHFPKYGLTFYYKENLSNSEDRNYFVQEGPAAPPIPSVLLNRFNFDRDVKEHNRNLGIEFINAKAKDIQINSEGNHNLSLKSLDETVSELEAKWIIDTTGRNRFLTKKFDLKKEPEYQRSAFWFRLADYDRSILDEVPSLNERYHTYDQHKATHHFLGKGNWIWCIPMRNQEYNHLISVGMVYRPDLYPDTITKIDHFLAHVDKEHPVLADLVRSGKVIDTNVYKNYMYESKQIYSPDRWFIVGSAAHTSDPLYSNGIALTCVQITQVNEMIAREQKGSLTTEFIQDLESCFLKIRNTVQSSISRHYDVMHDPYAVHWHINLLTGRYFHFILPFFLNGYFSDRVGAQLTDKIFKSEEKTTFSIERLIEAASKRMGTASMKKVTNKYYDVVNWDLKHPCEANMASYLVKFKVLMAKYRWMMLQDAGWNSWPEHISICAADLVQAGVLNLFFKGKSLKNSSIIKSYVSLGRKNVKQLGALAESHCSKSSNLNLANTSVN